MTEKFENIKSLIQRIQADKQTRNVTQKRFPIRYIFLSKLDTLRELVKETLNIGISIFEMSELLPKRDGRIDKQEIIENIKKLDKNKDYLLLPFSEIVRFYDKLDFHNLFSQLNELENVGNTNQRLYIPLLGLKARFENEFYKKFNRKYEYSFVWEINEPIKRKTIFLFKDTNLTIKKIHIVKEAIEWFNLWKKDVPSQILVLSKILFYYSDNAKPDEIFDLIKLNNEKELIQHIFKLEIPIEYKNSEKEFWRKIIEYLHHKSYNSFYDLVKEVINTNKLNKQNALDLWLSPKRSDFEKWIIKNYLLTSECEEKSYFCQVLSKLQSFDNLDLLVNIFNTIFDIKNPQDKIYEERINLLNQFYTITKFQLPQDFIEDYKQKLNKADKKTKLKLITGHLFAEQELILKVFNETGDIEILSKYPLLKNYVEDFEVDNLKEEQEWVYDYFDAYKKSKLQDIYTNEIRSKIDQINANDESFYKWYYSFDNVSSFLNNETFDYIFWIDALGIEWLPVIEFFLTNKKYNIENKFIARVNLPTTTEANKYEGNKIEYIQDFDRFVHNTIYTYPKTIIEELEKLKEIFEKIIIQKNKKAIIISDHGLSALVRLNASSKNFPYADHEGRYMKVKNKSFQPDENYILKDNYIIASKHISLSTKPKREVHGGCTPEEVLVPVVIFNSFENYEKQKITYKIELQTKEINIKNPKIIFKISPEPEKRVLIYIKDKKIQLSKNKKNIFVGNVPVKKASQYIIKLKIGNFEQEFQINIKSGFKEQELF